MRVVDTSRLPDETIPRMKLHVENSAPDHEKPELPADIERELADIDRRSASCYAEMEELAYRTHRAAEKLKNGR